MSAPESLVVEQVPIDRLRPDPSNPRQISAAALDDLTRSLQEFGNVQPLVALLDGMVVGGHQRLVGLRRLGFTTVPVVWVDLPPDKARLLGMRLNTSSGTWDDQLLARLLKELDAVPGLDLTLSGFADDDINDFITSLDARERQNRIETFDLDDALDEARQLRSKSGELWHLGSNRLLSGDATNPDDVARVLGDRRPALTVTDPPYNVNLGDHGGRQRGSRRRRMANDDLDGAAFDAFVNGWAKAIIDATDGAIYISMSGQEWPTVARILAEAGGHWSTTLIWFKPRFVLGRADFQRAYEPIWYGWREGAKHFWRGDRDQSDVWQIGRPADAPLHPVMKPLALIERAINNSSRPGDLVFDPFVGSGSTIIAGERTGRPCAAIEIDPVYVDVTLRRWERFTDGTAVRSDD